MINFENNQDKIELNEEILSLIEKQLDNILTEEGVEYEGEVGVYFVDDEKIKDINNEFRNLDKATDVLSFPTIAYEEGKVFKELYSEENLRDDMFLGDSLILGDVVISLERAKAQSEEYGHSFKREVVFLFTHSILHLLGYDHMDEGEMKKKMNEKEDYYMNKLGLQR